MAVVNETKVLALGFFDSLHCGHRYLFEKGKEISEKLGIKLSIVTFNDNFFKNLHKPVKEVFTLNERLEILKSLGYEDIIIIDPAMEFLALESNNFLEYLMQYNPAAIVAGSDYRFGKNGAGDIDELKEFFNKKSVHVVEVDLQKAMNEKISSTKIRYLLEIGDIEGANNLLCGNYFITGEVIKGRGVGRKIGIPTANIDVNFVKQLPKEGVYKTKSEIDGIMYDSITNVGIHPTFCDNNFNIETLIINFQGDLYKKIIKVFFVKRIRDISKFENSIKLVEQIENDIKNNFNIENNQ